MPDGDLAGNAGKQQRVTGVFVFMVGAGIVLETRARWLGTLVMLCGAAAFVWGMVAVRRGRVAKPAPVAATPAPEGNR